MVAGSAAGGLLRLTPGRDESGRALPRPELSQIIFVEMELFSAGAYFLSEVLGI